MKDELNPRVRCAFGNVLFFSMSSEALDSTPRLEVNLDEEGLAHTRALGLALALLSGVLMTVYSRCPTTRMAFFMFSEL